MYEQYLRDPASVGEEWRQLFDNGKVAELPVIPTSREEVEGIGARGSGLGMHELAPSPEPRAPSPGLTPITGPAARLAQNMTDSLSVPTATSFREITVDVLDARRRELNAQLAAAGKKVSYTHLIGYAITRAARELPVMTHAFQDVDGKPHRFDPRAVNLGLAVDVEKKDGSHALVVPVIKHAEGMDFATFHATYETLVDKARTNKLVPDDFAGATITLTNPGTIGTVASVPRLMKGQGSIIATGAIRTIGGAKVMTISSTYDHRIIQGAESGMFLRRLDSLLQGDDNFYGAVFESLGVGAGSGEQGAVRAAAPPAPSSRLPAPDELKHVAAAMALVKAIRNFGHLAARLDPLGSEPPGDPALDPGPLGLTPEIMARIPADLLRIYVPGRTLAEAYPKLQETYCGTIAYEVEHIGSHQERVWLRQVIESGDHKKPLAPEMKRKLLARLTAVETLERFLHKAYLGQKRFSIEGLDALVPMLDQTVELAGTNGARRAGRRGRDVQPGAPQGLHHRGHHPSDREQPARLHHRSEGRTLHRLLERPRQGLRCADHPRQRGRRGGVPRRGAARDAVSRQVPRRRGDRSRRLPALGSQRRRRAGLHAARDVRADQADAHGAPALRRTAGARGGGGCRAGGRGGGAGLSAAHGDPAIAQGAPARGGSGGRAATHLGQPTRARGARYGRVCSAAHDAERAAAARARRLYDQSQAPEATGAAPPRPHRGSDRVGPRGGPGVRIAPRRGNGDPAHGPGHGARHVQPATPRAARRAGRPPPCPDPESSRGAGAVRAAQQPALRGRVSGLRVRLRRRGARDPGPVGGPVRRLHQWRRSDHRPVHHRRARQVGADVPPHAALTARLRGSRTRALERPHRALSRARCRREYPYRQLHDAGAVLPFAAAPGASRRAAAAGVVHAEEPAAPAAGELAARRPHGWAVQPRARRRDGGGPSRRCAPAHPVQRQGVLRSHARARAGPGNPRGDRSGGALVSVPQRGAGDADPRVSQPTGDRVGAGRAAQHGSTEVHAAAAPRAGGPRGDRPRHRAAGALEPGGRLPRGGPGRAGADRRRRVRSGRVRGGLMAQQPFRIGALGALAAMTRSE